ncbi:2,3-dihydro-2,3-dihydroxybenzoate dehydrogenase [Pilimelia columellifera]|uniref:2,3-dihydro-2,3-dihydroxybenzoate dehydrogenase n=1 Tax=Pilimelia columellifera subsp. columellifera TaxID=706583 RepID=A0ABN3N1Q1_9ACTN
MYGDSFRGRVALVTGAAGGIGAAVAAALAEHGAAVASVDIDADGLSRDAGRPNCRHYVCDVSDAAQVADTVRRVEQDLGPVDICVNAAGVLRPGPAAWISDADWAATFAVNVTGVMQVSRAVAGQMTRRRRGVIITVSSNAGGVPRAGMAAYAASKAASTMFTKCLGLELARHGVRCNVVAPGSTDTAMGRQLWTDDRGADAVIAGDPDAFRVGIPLGRIADPADIADAVVFLASDAARQITMHDLYVDGGASLRA